MVRFNTTDDERESGMSLPADVNRCFVCGKGNPDGLQLDFEYDAKSHSVETIVNLPARFQGATGFAHGGIIATLLDEAMAKVNGKGGIRAVTIQLNVSYKKMVPLETDLVLKGKRARERGRKIYLRSSLFSIDGVLLAEGRGIFLQRSDDRRDAR
jgi:acyl-coenzyme A thioesterase PaaI-like protein